jgi:hypothetical protein
MDAIAEQIISSGLQKRAYAWPVETVTVPCAVVGYPTSLDFDATFNRGSDNAIHPVYFVVGKVSDRTARDELSGIIANSINIKTAIDGTLGDVVSSANVTDCQIQEITIGAVQYIAARFEIEIYS